MPISGGMIMFQKTVAWVTVVCLMWSSFATGVWAAEYTGHGEGPEAEEEAGEKVEEKTRGVRTIVGQGDEGWTIVDIRQVMGKLVLVSPMIGREIDLTESNRFAMFHGRNAFNQKVDLRLFDIAVPGFQSAMFLQRSNGKPGVKIRYRSGPKLYDRMFPMRGEDDLRRVREYIEHFEEIQKGDYKLGKQPRIEADAEYPKYTDEEITFETRVTRFGLARRAMAQVVLKNGEKVQGELIPFYEDGQILVETDLNARRIAVEEIDRLRLLGDRGAGAVGAAFRIGFGSAISGALMGALAAWQAGGDPGRTAVYVGTIFGGIGFLSGLLTGSRRRTRSREFVLGPLPAGRDQQGDKKQGDDQEKAKE